MNTASPGMLLLALAIAGAPLPPLAAAPGSRSVHVSWNDVPIEVAMQNTARAARGDVALLCDSYLAETSRTSRQDASAAAEEIIRQLARDHGRQLVRADRRLLLRHVRWFDLAFARRTGGRGRLPQKAVLQRAAVAPEVVLTAELLRVPLSTLGDELRKLTGVPHVIATPLRVRRVSGYLPRATPAELRGLLVTLFPDSEWEQRSGKWFLEERPVADLIRAVAQRGATREDEEMRTAAALYTQAAGELDASDLNTLRLTGRASLDWTRLSPASRGLLRERAQALQPVLERDRLPSSFFPDFSRAGGWAVEFIGGPGGSVRPRTRALNSEGGPVFFY